MDDRIGRLGSRLPTLTRGRAPTSICYPAAVRAEIVGLAHEAQAAGTSLRRLATQLGLPRGTIVRWQHRAPRRAAGPCGGSRSRRSE